MTGTAITTTAMASTAMAMAATSMNSHASTCMIMQFRESTTVVDAGDGHDEETWR